MCSWSTSKKFKITSETMYKLPEYVAERSIQKPINKSNFKFKGLKK